VLPDCGPALYLRWLRSGCDKIRAALPNPALSSGDRTTLEEILFQSDLVASRWDQAERFCERFPKTLVHGDFVAKNIRIRNGGAGLVLLALDWETAGWAVPAADLGLVHAVDVYWSVSRDLWPFLSLGDVLQLREYGKIFRLVASVYWASCGLHCHWVQEPMTLMRLYHSRLADAIRVVGWEG
jgi:aminoglycoside phosphotransferase (APT) family kinase protein